jgi:hypothetical protein
VSTIPFGLFIDADTGTFYETTGEQWVQIGQLPAGTSLPGVASDNSDGIIVDGTVTSGIAGGFVAVVRNNNALTVQDEIGTVLARINASGRVTAARFTSPVFSVLGTANDEASLAIQPFAGQPDPPFLITDPTGAVFEVWADTGGVLHARNGFSSFAGGIGLFGHAIQGTQPTMTLTTSTITDANAKATIKALISIVNGCGLAAITES